MQFINNQDQQQQPVDPYMNSQAANLLNQKEYLDVLKHYAEDDSIPDEIKKSQWAIHCKALGLTFLEEKDLPLIDMFNQVLRIDALMDKPPHMISFNDTHELDQNQLFFFLKAKSAIGSNKGKMNERTLQVTQIGQSISTQTLGQMGQNKGMLQKLKGLF